MEKKQYTITLTDDEAETLNYALSCLYYKTNSDETEELCRTIEQKMKDAGFNGF